MLSELIEIIACDMHMFINGNLVIYLTYFIYKITKIPFYTCLKILLPTLWSITFLIYCHQSSIQLCFTPKKNSHQSGIRNSHQREIWGSEAGLGASFEFHFDASFSLGWDIAEFLFDISSKFYFDLSFSLGWGITKLSSGDPHQGSNSQCQRRVQVQYTSIL